VLETPDAAPAQMVPELKKISDVGIIRSWHYPLSL